MTGSELEPTKEKQERTHLTQMMREGAALDATGMSPPEIAAIVGVSRQTVSTWRGYKLYQEEVDKWVSRDVANIKPLIEQLRVTALVAADRAIKELLQALDAEDKDGNPRYNVRLQAAREIVNMPVVRGLVERRVSEETGITANQVVQVVFSRDDGGKDEVKFSAGEVEEGELVEDPKPSEGRDT